MSTTFKMLGIDRLSVSEQLQLVEEIWDGIAASVEATDIPQSHKDELDRRLTALRDDPQGGSTWEVVKTRLRRGSGDTP